MPTRLTKLSFMLLALLGSVGVGFMALPLPTVTPAIPYAAVVVLGAAQYAGKPSPAFKRRLDHAFELYEAGNIEKIVVTGGRRPNDPFTEGEVGVNYLQGRGVPQSALLAETRSRTTIENLQNAQTYLPHGTPITLVTDEAHAPRALALARALGLTANANPSPLSRQPDWHYLFREKLALMAYTLLGVRG